MVSTAALSKSPKTRYLEAYFQAEGGRGGACITDRTPPQSSPLFTDGFGPEQQAHMLTDSVFLWC